jgi:choline dehydrogenase
LLLSGIGPPDELESVGIRPTHPLAGVGKNLQDHLLVSVVYQDRTATLPGLSMANLARWSAHYALTGRGQAAVAPVEAGAFVKLRSGATVPDLQFHFIPFTTPGTNTDKPRKPAPGPHFTLLPSLIYPTSVGELRLRSSDPAAPPAIDPRAFSEPADLDTLVDGVGLAREIAVAGPLARYRGKETWPGAEARSRDEIAERIRQSVNTIFHPVGTCRMGTDEGAVVDPDLRVRGLTGLRVADASIMPRIIGGNTNAPAIMIGEKAADLIRGCALPPEPGV